MAFQFRRGTDAERQSITPRPGEPLYVTDTGQVYVGDGTTQGGNLVSLSVSDDESPSLSGSLDLNGNDITGTGDIDITGSIHATGTITADGNITLGDGAEDNVIVGGVISSSLIPSQDGRYDLGDNLSSWRNGFFEGLDVDGTIRADSLKINSIVSDDSTIIYNSDLDTLNVSTIIGNIIGSVFTDDSSTVLVDALDGEIKGNINTTNLVVSKEDGDVLSENLAVFNGINDSQLPFVEINIAKNNLNNPESLLPGDEIGGYRINAYSNGDFKTVTALLPVLTADTDITALNPKTDLLLALGNNATSTFYEFQGSGIFKAPSAIKTGTFNNETARDEAIPNPEPGMIIFLSSRDDSSGFPVFQGYDGVEWRDL